MSAAILTPMADAAPAPAGPAPVLDEALLRRVEQFIFGEAHLQDTHAYDAWEALWTDDAIYWIPANGEDTDPETKMSIVYDNRSRLKVRIDQLKTGRRHTQTPRSALVRVVSNIQLLSRSGNEVEARSNALVFEENLRAETVWATRNEYRLREVDGALRMVRKKVVLANNHRPIFTLSFLI